jgi:hypothetical protein
LFWALPCAFQVTRIQVKCCRDERFVKVRRVNTNFLAELKRRNVYKVAVVYAIVGWLAVQIATQVFPFLEIPNWIVRLVIVLVAIGFPIALVLAWAFELSPEGIKRTDDVDLPAGSGSKNRTWIYVAVIGVAFSVGLFLSGVTRRGTAVGRLRANCRRNPSRSCRCLTKAVTHTTNIFRMGYRKN